MKLFDWILFKMNFKTIAFLLYNILFIGSLFSFVSCSSIEKADLASYHVSGNSMSPLIKDGVYLGVDSAAYDSDVKPNRGDIVLFTRPSKPDLVYALRIVGLPGEQVIVQNHNVFINGTQLDEPYVETKAEYQGEWQLKENEYFILGDNRQASADSHLWGAVNGDSIFGKAIFICNSDMLINCSSLHD